MQARRTDRRRGTWAEKKLRAAVHCHAFRTEPRAYLVAAWWRLHRKKLRSHYQFAALFGRSPYAYALWLLREAKEAASRDESATIPPIIALIDARAGQEKLRETVDCLSSEGIIALPFGTRDLPTLADAAKRIDWSTGPWLMPLTAGDRLAYGAATAYRATIADKETRIIYADDDLLDSGGGGYHPHFKPDWNAELFRHFDYLTGASLLRATREDIEAVAAMPDWARTLTIALMGEGQPQPVHLPRMLHHRRARPLPRIPAAPEIADRDLPPVSLIIPTRNRADLLRTCLKGVTATDYPEIETIIVDNDSDDPQTLDWLASLDPARHRVLRHTGPFNFSAINNRAAAEARGRLLCLLNNDIEMIGPDWLRIMAVQAQRENVGAVGAQLLYPDGRIQHAGVVIGMGNAAGHAHRFLRPDEEGYFHRHALPQFTMAVTAACLVVARDRFLAVGGLDEENFPVAFNDVDLCLRLNGRGWQSFYEPRARLIHHESISRGLDRDPAGAARFASELAALKRLWHTEEVVDPFHHPQLSRASEQFALRL